jgi:hypothetical protein
MTWIGRKNCRIDPAKIKGTEAMRIIGMNRDNVTNCFLQIAENFFPSMIAVTFARGCRPLKLNLQQACDLSSFLPIAIRCLLILMPGHRLLHPRHRHNFSVRLQRFNYPKFCTREHPHKYIGILTACSTYLSFSIHYHSTRNMILGGFVYQFDPQY